MQRYSHAPPPPLSTWLSNLFNCVSSVLVTIFCFSLLLFVRFSVRVSVDSVTDMLFWRALYEFLNNINITFLIYILNITANCGKILN
jgi:hypothetical protein